MNLGKYKRTEEFPMVIPERVQPITLPEKLPVKEPERVTTSVPEREQSHAVR